MYARVPLRAWSRSPAGGLRPGSVSGNSDFRRDPPFSGKNRSRGTCPVQSVECVTFNLRVVILNPMVGVKPS